MARSTLWKVLAVAAPIFGAASAYRWLGPAGSLQNAASIVTMVPGAALVALGLLAALRSVGPRSSRWAVVLVGFAQVTTRLEEMGWSISAAVDVVTVILMLLLLGWKVWEYIHPTSLPAGAFSPRELPPVAPQGLHHRPPGRDRPDDDVDVERVHPPPDERRRHEARRKDTA